MRERNRLIEVLQSVNPNAVHAVDMSAVVRVRDALNHNMRGREPKPTPWISDLFSGGSSSIHIYELVCEALYYLGKERSNFERRRAGQQEIP